MAVESVTVVAPEVRVGPFVLSKGIWSKQSIFKSARKNPRWLFGCAQVWWNRLIISRPWAWRSFLLLSWSHSSALMTTISTTRNIRAGQRWAEVECPHPSSWPHTWPCEAWILIALWCPGGRRAREILLCWPEWRDGSPWPASNRECFRWSVPVIVFCKPIATQPVDSSASLV